MHACMFCLLYEHVYTHLFACLWVYRQGQVHVYVKAQVSCWTLLPPCLLERVLQSLSQSRGCQDGSYLQLACSGVWKGRFIWRALCQLRILTSLSTSVQMWDWARGLASDYPSSHFFLKSQQTSYPCDLHCFLHHFLLILFYVFFQSKKDIHFSIRDYFIIKISVKQEQKVVFLTLL